MSRSSNKKRPQRLKYSISGVTATLTLTCYLLAQLNNSNNNNSSQALAATAPMNYLLFARNSTRSLEEIKLERLLKDTNHSHVSDSVDLKLANLVWTRMGERAREFARLSAQAARPTINQLLERAGVSLQCKHSLNGLLDHLAQLDQWAVEMYNSNGDFPASGFFEGSFTSMGAYHQCVNVAPRELIGRPQYCTLSYQPIVPKRPRYHNILATIDNLANFTSPNDMFHGLAKKAQYFYYTKLRLATCMPSKCTPADMDLIGEQIALNTYLQYQGVQCLEKAEPFNPDGAQIFALAILIGLASISIAGTLVHVLKLRPLVARNLSVISERQQSTGVLGSVPVVDLGAKINGLTHNVVMNGQQESNNNNTDLSVATKVDLHAHLPNYTDHLVIGHQDHKGLPLLPLGPEVAGGREAAGKASRSPATRRLLRVLDILMHFSVLRNGRKLFDTSTSHRGSNNGGRKQVDINAGTAQGGECSSSSASSTTGSAAGESASSVVSSGAGGNDAGTAVSGQANDIGCVHGLRFWTISWIILGHTMQYTEWAGFGRAFQVEENITSFFLHPLLNATFSVDTFFLISGLLTTYVTWTITRGHYYRFNKFAFLISRYLRLMPQVLIVILIFIVFPLFGDGPYWRGQIEKESRNCKQNWWVSALFLQSFYNQDQICNLVTWWLSIEMFYHFTSIIVIIALLHSARKGLLAALLVGGGLTSVSCYLHFVNHYPPNMLPTLLQRYEIWDSIVLKYFWTPYPHAPSYFVGLLLGYALYNQIPRQLTRRQVRYGWVSFAICYLTILFGTYHWNNNAPYSRLISTSYYNLSQIFWSLATGWAILACALGHGGWLNSFLSSPCFIPLGRATYMTYLSHMLIVMSYPAKMNLLIEPSYIVFLYIFISNLVLSYALGILLTLVYESPILHLQKLLVSQMANKFNDEADQVHQSRKQANRKNRKNLSNHSVKVSLYTQAQQQQLHQETPAA